MTSAAIATLAGDKPVLLFDVSPIAMSPALFTPLTPRYQVLATRLGVSSMDETAVRAKIEGYLGKPVNTYWTQAGAERRWIATPRPWPPASSLFATPANTITQDTLLLFAGAPDLGTLSDAQVTSFFSRAGWTLDIVEPYWFEADVARGKSYDALKAAHGAKAPLAWQEADGRRSAGESAALEALLARTPAASPLWEGALLNAAARSAHVSDGYKRSMLLGAMTSGYMQSTSVDTSWDAFEALQGCTSCETGFARPRLLVYAGRLRSMADARDLFALEPLLVDARMPEETVRDTLLVAVDASVKAHDYPQFDHPARALSATVIRTLDARTDLSAPTRQVLLRATDRLIDVARGGAAP